MSEMYCDESSSKKTTKTNKKEQPRSGDMPSGRESDSDEEESPKPVKRK